MSRIDAKVVLLGKSYVGKTCLVNRYIHGRFDGTNYQNTIGAAFGSKREKVDGQTVMLGLWDTAGHERYESMTRMYYRGAAAAILCYDVTDKSSLDRTRFWAAELKSTQEDCKIFLCATKKDIADNEPGKVEVTLEMAQPLADDLQADLIETSSVTGENIDLLFQKIAKYILEKKEQERRQLDQEQVELIHIGRGRERLVGGCKLFSCFR